MGFADTNGSQFFASVRSNFPNLQELRVERSVYLGDVSFIGENGELPFLQLTSTKNIYFYNRIY